MYIVIVGIGKVGSTVAAYLSREGEHEVVVVDKNPDIVERMANNYDVLGFCGNGAAPEIQQEAGMNKADLVVAMTSSDEFNILCCILARKVGAKHTIARVRNPDYFHQMSFLRQELGLSMAVNPELEAANAISRMLRFPSAIKLELFSKGRLEMAEIVIPEGSILENLTLKKLPQACQAQVLICAVRRGEEVFIPDGDFVLQAGDYINVTASHGNMNEFFKILGIYQDRIKTVLLVGGGKVAFYLARQLIPLGMRVEIVEQNADICQNLSEALPKATILHGDGTDQELLLEEGLATVDACVSLTGIDEENVIISMFASMKKVKKVITKINRLPLLAILHKLGIESVISPRVATGELILRYVRALHNSEGSSVQTLYKLLDGQVEALEFVVSKNAVFVEKTLEELPLKKGILLAGIVRSGRLIHPKGSDVMLPGDLVVVVTTLNGLQDLHDILAED
ncbi:MAG TPA: Trk system potassium transporter TrkA [Candidatus Anaerotruncus excrementipullorum]|uniref:Trk system potassium uptake protein TrkA n=1 Tax=Candidatus Anaerotruncus excrementipullorum TaxID=2838465 RepID=A0A9D1WQT4_9FIRM|nr:Trk system potassium transporter TrkA [Candidatus Anaerotruncus excrementipullorum]